MMNINGLSKNGLKGDNPDNHMQTLTLCVDHGVGEHLLGVDHAVGDDHSLLTDPFLGKTVLRQS